MSFSLRAACRAIACLAVPILLLAGCGDDDDAADAIDDTASIADEGVEEASELGDEQTELAETLRDNGLATLATAVEAIDLSEIVSGEFTLFAPTDDAFLDLGAETTADLLADPAELLNVLESHVADTTVMSTDIGGVDEITTRTGATFPVDTADGVRIGNATVVQADITLGDGVIHVIDAVLEP